MALPSKCTITGYLYDSANVAMSGVTVTAVLNYNNHYIDSSNSTSTEIVSTPITATTNASGIWTMDLVNTDLMKHFAYYKFTFSKTGMTSFSISKFVPNSATAVFSNLMDA